MKKLNKKLNVNFNDGANETIESLLVQGLTKSQVARAAMNIGLSMVGTAKISMTEDEFRKYVWGEEYECSLPTIDSK